MGVCSMELSNVANFRGAQCLVEDEHLQKRVILGSSTTISAATAAWLWCYSGQSAISALAIAELVISSFCCDENFDAGEANALDMCWIGY